MMRAILLLAILAASWPAAAQQSLRVRTAEQAESSRVIVDIPPATRWSADREGRTLWLRFPRQVLEFETESSRFSFTGHGTSRIATTEAMQRPTGTTLTIGLACDCSVDVRALGPRTLVVEVRDDPDRAVAPPAEDRVQDTFAPAEGRREIVFVPGATDAAEAPPSQEVDAVEEPPSGDAAAGDLPAQPTPPTTDPSPELDTAEAVRAARARLLEQLARAADEGLIEVAEPGLPQADEIVAPPEPPIETAEIEELPSAEPELDTQIRIRRPADPLQQISIDLNVADGNCIADERLDIAGWTGSAPVAVQIATLRAGLLNDDGAPDGAAVTALARLYIHYGFGVEATALLTSFPDGVADGPLLLDLARLMDDRPGASEGPLAAAGGCGGRAALWHLLAHPEGPADSVDNADLLASFGELPRVQRRLVGPRLVEALLDRGDVATAEGVLAVVARLPGPHGASFTFAQARLAAAGGRYEEAEAAYRSLIAGDAPNAPRAMIALLESRLQRDVPPPPELAEDLALLAYMHRGASLGVALRKAETRARAGRSELGRALDIAREAMMSDRAAAGDLRAAAHQILATAEADKIGHATYAQAVLGFADLLARDVSGDGARLVVANELTSIGLANAALTVLQPTLARDDPAARLAAARAYLSLDRPTRALAELNGVAEEAARPLLVEAHIAAGSYAAARAAIPGTDLTRDAALAWFQGDWPAAARSVDPRRRAMAGYMARLDPRTLDLTAARPIGAGAERTPAEAFLASLAPAGTDELSLGVARDLLSVTRGTRSFLEEALSDG
ncbi:MAG: hypothetical protein AAGE18_02450 [Pseudomonadota bacterium]